MKKFFKALAVVMALTLVIGTIPASAATTGPKTAKKLYIGGAKGEDANGVKSSVKKSVSYAYLLGITKDQAADAKVTAKSSKKTIAKARNDKQRVYAKGIGKATVTLTYKGKDYKVKVTVKKNAEKVNFGADWAKVEDTFEATVGTEYTVSLPRLDGTTKLDTDKRRLEASDESVVIAPVEGQPRAYTVKFTKSGEFTVTGSAYQSETYSKATASKTVFVTVKGGDFDVQATGVKEITVTGKGFTKDTKFTVKRDGTISITVSSVEVSEDGTTAKLILANKLVKGKYSVASEGKEAEFEADDEKVDKIVIKEKDGEVYTTGVVSGSAVKGTTLTVHYNTFNQYGEDVTKSYPLTWYSSFGDKSQNDKPAKGYIQFTDSENVINYGSTVIFTATYNGSTYVTTETAQCKVGLSNDVNDIEIVGIVNLKTNKKVESGKVPAFFKDGEYAIYFNLIDRAGGLMEYKASDAENVQLSSQSPIILTVTSKPAADSVLVDGETYAYAVLSRGQNAKVGGEVQILVSSTKTGHSDGKLVEIEPESVLTNLVLSAPDAVVVEGEEVAIPFTATDADGNEIKDFRALVKSVTLTGNGYFRFEENEDRTASLKYTAPTDIASKNIDGTVILSSTVYPSGSTKQITLKVKDRAHRNTIREYKGQTKVVEGGSIDIKTWGIPESYENWLVYYDQYDRYNDGWWNKYKAVDDEGNKYYVGFETEYTDYITVSESGTTTDGVTNKITINTAITNLNETSKDVTVNFYLYTAKGRVPGSDKKVTFTIYDIKSLSGFSLNSAWPGYTTLRTSDHSITPEVSGKLADGTSLGIPNVYVEYQKDEIKGYGIGGLSTYDVLNVIDAEDTLLGQMTAGWYAPTLANYNWGGQGNQNSKDGAYNGDCDEVFIDMSGKNADGTNKTKSIEGKLHANVYSADIYADPTAATSSALVAKGLELKVTIKADPKYNAKLNVQTDPRNLINSRWTDDANTKAVVRPTDGYISYAVLESLMNTVADNYDRTINAKDANLTIEINSYAEASDDLYNKKTDATKLAKITNNAQNGVYIDNAEIFDTFTAIYQYGAGGPKYTVQFTVGADTEAIVVNTTAPDWY